MWCSRRPSTRSTRSRRSSRRSIQSGRRVSTRSFSTCSASTTLALPARQCQGLKLTVQEALSTGEAKFDLSVIVIPRGESRRHIDGDADPDELFVMWDYKIGRFEPALMRQMIRHYTVILTQMVADPSQEVNRIALLGAQERMQLLELGHGAAGVRHSGGVHESFERQVALTPDAVAIEENDQALSYRELNGRANQLARCLMAQGALPGDRIATILRRSIDLVVAQLAILKCGAAYVPLEASLPPDRLAFLLSDAEPRLLLSAGRIGAALPVGMRCLAIEELALADQPAAGPGSQDRRGPVRLCDVHLRIDRSPEGRCGAASGDPPTRRRQRLR